MLKAEGKINNAVIENMMNWHHSGFNVCCGPAICSHDQNAIENLARYIVQANDDKILMPILHEVELHLPLHQKQYAVMLKTSLESITSPFISQLSKTFLHLTATEIAICNLIRNGLQTKEIAGIRGVSVGTINRHREHIRRKLKITNSDINLMTYLQSEMGSKGKNPQT